MSVALITRDVEKRRQVEGQNGAKEDIAGREV
jgi:hypothetical protein